jgi:hypothetical protein
MNDQELGRRSLGEGWLRAFFSDALLAA